MTTRVYALVAIAPGREVAQCMECGSLVLSLNLHDQWHASVLIAREYA